MQERPQYLRDQYPFQSNFLETENVRLHYLDEGVGDPVVMLHGNPTWSFYYRNLVKALKADYRCIVPDHIGMGLSSKPQQYPYRLNTHIDNVERLLTHLGIDQFTLIVHDWGGAIGMGLAARMPERVNRIVVMNTAAFLSKEMPFTLNLCRVPGLGALLIRGFNAFAGLATSMAVRRKMSAEVKAGFLHPYDNWHNRIATLRFVQDIPMRESHPSYRHLQQIESSLAQLKEAPMLICWGERDFVFTDSFLAQWQQRFPDAIVHRYADAGHYVLEDAREEVIEQVGRFLRSE